MKRLVFVFMSTMLMSSLIWAQNITTSGSGSAGFIPASKATVLYEQLPSGTNLSVFTSQDFLDFPSYSNEGADDFIVPPDASWSIQTVTAFGAGWNGFVTGSLFANVKFYNDNLGQPGTLIQSYMNVPYTYPPGYPGILVVALPGALVLPPGHYWVSVAMVGSFGTYGQWGRSIANAITDNQGQWINPGGGFGYGSGWAPGSLLTGFPCDWAFRLEGDAGPSGVPLSNWALVIGGVLIATFILVRTISFRKP